MMCGLGRLDNGRQRWEGSLCREWLMRSALVVLIRTAVSLVIPNSNVLKTKGVAEKKACVLKL